MNARTLLWIFACMVLAIQCAPVELSQPEKQKVGDTVHNVMDQYESKVNQTNQARKETTKTEAEATVAPLPAPKENTESEVLQVVDEEQSRAGAGKEGFKEDYQSVKKTEVLNKMESVPQSEPENKQDAGQEQNAAGSIQPEEEGEKKEEEEAPNQEPVTTTAATGAQEETTTGAAVPDNSSAAPDANTVEPHDESKPPKLEQEPASGDVSPDSGTNAAALSDPKDDDTDATEAPKDGCAFGSIAAIVVAQLFAFIIKE